jgi:hypothetical protein
MYVSIVFNDALIDFVCYFMILFVYRKRIILWIIFLIPTWLNQSRAYILNPALIYSILNILALNPAIIYSIPNILTLNQSRAYILNPDITYSISTLLTQFCTYILNNPDITYSIPNILVLNPALIYLIRNIFTQSRTYLYLIQLLNT